MNYQATNIFSGFAQGTYTVCVQDANGCTANTSVTVGQPTAVTLGTTQTNVTCNGGNDGTITATAGGGTPAYQYSIDGVTYAANPTFTGLVAGAYTIYTQDANGCGTNTNVTISEPTAILPSAVATNVSCNGGNNGTITASASGGTGAYSYSLDGVSYQGATLFSGLTAGIYSVYVKDANGCVATFSTTITEPTALTGSTTATNVLCNGGATGSITVSAANGTSPYTYNVNGGAYGANPTFTGLIAATYAVNVQDANGCILPLSATVTEPTALIASAVSTAANCNGASNGTITINANGGTPNYQYASDCLNYQAGNTFSGFAAATYTVCVQDANGCTANTSVTVSQPVAVSVSTTQTDVSCNAGNNGIITAAAAGGTGTYQYSIDGVTYGVNPNFTGLTAGNYTIYAQDANLCVGTTNVTINQPTAVVASATVTNVSCNAGTNGSITVSGSGGTGTYTYSIDGVNYQGAALFSNLTAATYSVYVQDANACIGSSSVTITQPTAITGSTTVTNVLCNGGSTGSITVTASGGTGTLNYNLNGGAFGTNPTFSGLTANNYLINVQDANACLLTLNATVTEPTALTASANATNVSCNAGANGTITITANGGTPNYSYASDCLNYGASNIFSGFGAGTYTVCVQDANACTANTSITITQPTPIQLSETHTNVACNGGNNGAINLSVVGGTGTYTYLWSNTATTEDISGLTANLYSVNVADANNCQTSLSVNITQPSALSLTTSIVTPIACFGGTASVSVSAAGGTTPYTGTGTFTFSAGTQNILVSDANGCAANTSISITEPTALSAASTFTAINCNGGTSTVTVTASGGTAPYSGTGNQTSLAGNYTYLVTDANGCSANTSGTITEPAAISLSAVAPPITCFNGNTLVTISATGGVAPYTGTGNFTVQAGNYVYPVTDANGCTASANLSIAQPAALSVNITNVKPADCAGLNGGATAQGVGGSGTYIYSWVPGNYTSPSPANMPAGTYTVYVKDIQDPSCMTSTTVTIGFAGNLVINNAFIQNATCNGFCDGSITVFATGGSGNYSYVWSSGQTTQNLTGLCAGTYDVTISDATTPFCQVTSSYTIQQPSAISLVVASQNNVTCNGATNGNATITTNGGWGNYAYSWSNGQTTSNLANVGAGTYTLTVMDSLCTANVSVNITQNNPISLVGSATNTPCNTVNLGSVTINPTGGSGSFNYAWSNGATSQNLAGLPAGNYTVTVSETNDPSCTAQATFTVATDFNLVATAQVLANPACGTANGTAQALVTGGSGNYNYLWSDGQTTQTAVGLTGTTYSVAVFEAAQTGCSATASITLVEPAAPTNMTITPSGSVTFCEGDFVSLSANATNANSYIWLWNNQVIASGTSLSAILPGTYQAVAYSGANGSGCSLASSVVTLTVLDKAVASVAIGGNSGICDSDSILLIASGGSVFQWFRNLQPIAGATNSTYYAKTSGLYSVSVANSCNADTSDVKEIVISEGVVADFNTTPDVVYTQQPIQFVDSSLNGYTWSWIFADNTGSIEQNPIHKYDGPGQYPVTLIVYDKYGCVDSITYVLTIEDADVPFIPNVFTPNGDGIGDEVTIEYQDVTPTSFHVFDRWGHDVFFTTKKDVKWSGTDVNGKVCNEGVYFYILEGTNALGEKVVYKGNITLMK